MRALDQSGTGHSAASEGTRPAVPVPDPFAAAPLCDQFDAVLVGLGGGAGRVAVRDASGASVSYAELGRLCAGGVGVDAARRPVAVLGGSAAALALAVAIVYGGSPLVLLDPQLPVDRLRHILAGSGACRTIVADGLEPLAREAGAPRVVTASEILAEAGAGPSGPRPQGGAPATIVYTSGSTGLPKGVTLSHAAVTNGAATSRTEFGLRAGDACAMLLPPAYAAGQEVLFMAILNGCTVESFDPRERSVREIADWLRGAGVTTLHCTPSMLRHLNGHLAQETFPRVRLFTTCGEPVHGRDVAAARGYLPAADYANYVGSSETGHLSFLHIGAGDPVPAAQLPAGRLAQHKAIAALGAGGEALPDGEVGVLEVTSPFLALGYWGEPDRTAEAFRATPSGSTFRTGDRGSVQDGRLSLAGRRDDAVKIRGYLVEPAEVTAALRGIAEVTDAAVVPDREGRRLIGYVVPDPARRPPSTAQLRRELAGRVPDWMVPQSLVLLDELPRTERGKLDRAALPEPAGRSTDTVPADQWEALVSAVWCQVLHLEGVGRDESFAELGGDSLAVEEMLAKLAEDGVDLRGSDLAAAPTMAEFAARVRAATTPRTDSSAAEGVMASLRRGPGVPVYCFSGAGGPAYLFTDLARHLGGDHPVTAFQVRGLERRAIPDWSVRRAARRYVDLIAAERPPGPVVLIGHSLGGLFALEAAHLLRERGYGVELTVMLDTLLPGSLAHTAGEAAPEIRIPGGQAQSRRELWRTRVQLLGAGIYPYPPAVRDQVFFQHGLRLTERYRVRPWDGYTEVFLTPENIDDRAWWRQVLTGEYLLHEVECGHVAILKPPYVNRVADLIRTTLDHSVRLPDAGAGRG